MSSRLPIKAMQHGETVSLAGHHFFLNPIRNACLYFMTDEDKALKVEPSSLGALVPTKTDEKTLREIEIIPSIVGNDFLEDQGFSFTFNPGERVAFLEKM